MFFRALKEICILVNKKILIMDPITSFSLVLLGGFLATNFFVGYRETRGIKTLRDYALANKNLGSGILVATLVATLLDVSNIGLKISFLRGAISLMYPAGLAVSSFFVGYFIFPKLIYFRKEYTIVSVMNTLYGSTGRYFTLVVSSFFSLFIIISFPTTNSLESRSNAIIPC